MDGYIGLIFVLFYLYLKGITPYISLKMTLSECFRSGMHTASLERVNFSNNEITTFGFSRLCECLVKNQIISKLIMNNNNLSGKGITIN